MATPPTVVQLHSIAKRFGSGPPVLDGVSLEAAAGDFISFIGPSGCGKSTLLRLIAGLLPITEGQLRFNDDALNRAEMAFVFQEPTLLPWLNVANNVEAPLKLRGISPAERTTRRTTALTQVRLNGRERAYPRQLSGGQKMRVSIARALALKPKLLLLDEPFGALDEMTRDHLNEELLTIRAAEEWTAFFVTHSVAEAVFLSNRVFVLSANPGRIHAEFKVPFAYPRTPETRRSDEYHHWVVRISESLRSVEKIGTV